MAITSLDDLIAGFVYPAFPVLKGLFTPAAAGAWTSLWTVAGIPGAGANSSDGVAGAIPTDATPGALPFSNVDDTYLGRLSGWGTVSGMLLLYDRLWHNSGLSPTTVGAQTVNSVALDRPDSNGHQAEAWWQAYTTMGAGATAPTIDYTDSSGNAGNTGTVVGFVATAAAARTLPFSLAAGDTGVKSIQSYDNVASHTSGTFGLIIRRLITSILIGMGNSGASVDAVQLGLPRIYDNACLEFLWLATATTALTVGGSVQLAQG